jgi:hypothetical protein
MDDPTTIVLWGVAALLLGWTWVPALIAGLGGSRYANGGTDDPSALDAANEPDYRLWADQLLSLGYAPIGAGFMRLSFHGSDWRYETKVRAFYSRAKQTYAFVQKLPRPLDVWWLTMFATVWRDGGLLLTGNGQDEAPGEGEYVVQGMESMDLTAVEALHAGQRDRLTAAGQKPETDGQFETLLAATERHSGRAARHLGIKLGQSYLIAHGMIHAFATFPAVYIRGLTDWAVPVVNIALGLLLGLSEYLAKHRAAVIMRQKIRAASVR